MLQKVEIRPNVGSALEVNTVDGSGNNLFPLHTFEIETAIDSEEFKKMAASGNWPSYAYPGAMTIHAEGDILGIGVSDAARSISYITQRLALLDAIFPPITGVLTARKHGVLRVRFDGMTEDADADIQLKQQSIPLTANAPAKSEFMITWIGFVPYFVGVTSATKYLLG